MGPGRFVGRVGGLAVALGAGAAVFYAGAVASADTSGPRAEDSDPAGAPGRTGPRSVAASHRSVTAGAIPRTPDRRSGTARGATAALDRLVPARLVSATATSGTLTDRADHQFGDGLRELHLVRTDEYLGCRSDDAEPHGLEEEETDTISIRT